MPYTYQICGTCNGTGTVTSTFPDGSSSIAPCQICDSSGKVHLGEAPELEKSISNIVGMCKKILEIVGKDASDVTPVVKGVNK
jgi:hypothetical protein